jgi:hypothetical protein
MRKVGSDYVFKILNREFFESVFRVRKKYYVRGKPSELGRGNIIYFVMKSEESGKYLLVGEGVCTYVGELHPFDSGYDFAISHNWNYVVELEGLVEYKQPIAAEEVFTETTLRKLKQQRPFGVPLSREEAKIVKEKVKLLKAT